MKMNIKINLKQVKNFMKKIIIQILLIRMILYIEIFVQVLKLMEKIQYQKIELNTYIQIMHYYVKVIVLIIIQILLKKELIANVLIKV